jgi:hypothetical protein
LKSPSSENESARNLARTEHHYSHFRL